MARFRMVSGRANQLQIASLCCLQQFKELCKRTNLFLDFCDIAKAYDSVDRELLHTKLDSVGFKQ